MTSPNWTVSSFTPPIPGPVFRRRASLRLLLSLEHLDRDSLGVIDGDKVGAYESRVPLIIGINSWSLAGGPDHGARSGTIVALDEE